MAVENQEIVISLDLGTTQIKAAAFDQDLKCLCTFLQENRLIYPAPGLIEQDPHFFFEGSVRLLQQVTQALGNRSRYVRAIAGSGQMSGILAIDRAWKPILNYYSILDPRSNRFHDQIAPYINHTLAISGGLTHQLEKILFWQSDFADQNASLCKFITPHVYVVGKLAGLSGEDAFIDKTFSCINGLMNVKTWDWETSLLDALEIPRKTLPRICDSDTIVARINPEWARRLDLPDDVAILAGSGDGAATFTGAGVCEIGMASDLSGTACAIVVYLDQFYADTQKELFMSIKSPIAPGWYLSYVNQFGRSHRWFVEEFFPDLLNANGGDFDKVYGLLDEQAAQIEPGCNGTFSIPHLSGRGQPPKGYYRGCFAGFGLGYKRAHFYRSLLESLPLEYQYAISQMRELGLLSKLSEIMILGGGSKSDFWNQLKSDILDVKYRRICDSDIITLRGDAMIAAKVLKWPIFEHLLDCIEIDREYYPHPEITEKYSQVAASYNKFDTDMDVTFSHLFS
jgi:xylulokinase